MDDEKREFLVILTQHGEGCDHTIGCGTRVRSIKAVNMEDAKAQAGELVEYYGIENIASATVVEPYEFGDVDVSALQESLNQQKQDARKAAELALMKKLIAKHGAPK